MKYHRKNRTSVITGTGLENNHRNCMGSMNHDWHFHPVVGVVPTLGSKVDSSKARAKSGKRPYLQASGEYRPPPPPKPPKSKPSPTTPRGDSDDVTPNPGYDGAAVFKAVNELVSLGHDDPHDREPR